LFCVTITDVLQYFKVQRKEPRFEFIFFCFSYLSYLTFSFSNSGASCIDYAHSNSKHKHATCIALVFTRDAYANPLTSTWPHLRCDVGLDEGEY